MKHPRRSYLIDYIVQFKLALFVMALMVISNVLYPIIVLHLFNSKLSLIQDKLPELALSIESAKTELVQLTILWQLCFLAISFVLSVIFGHRIVGPIFKIKKHFVETGTQNFQAIVLRNNDYFSDLAEIINKTIAMKQAHLKELKTQGNDLIVLKDKLSPEDQEQLSNFLNTLDNISL